MTSATRDGLLHLDPKWRAFGAIALVFVTIVFATSMSFLVLTSISEEFDVTLGAVSWVVIVESLIVAALLLPLGGVGDRLGRRRVLAAGMALFGVGCVLTGLAPTFSLVIVARIITSIGNALVQSIGTGLLVGSFPSAERGLAMGAQTTAVSVGSATGPLLTGVLLDVISWRAIFVLLAIPSAVSVISIVGLIERDEPTAGVIRRVNLRSAVLSAGAITALTLTINNPFDWSWRSVPIAVGLAISLVLFGGYVRWELASTDPMLDLRLFRIGAYRTAVMVRWIGFLAATTITLLLPILLLSVLEVDGVITGVVLSIMAVGTGVSAQVSGRLYDRSGPRMATIVGLGLQSAVLAAIAFVDTSTPWGWLAVAALIQGVALGLWNVPNNSAMMGATPPESFGVGGAFTNVTRTMGNVFGQAIAAAVVVAVLRDQGFDIPLGDIEDTPGAAPSFVDGWRLAMLISAALTVALGLVATRLGWDEDERRG
ncbi:MAG: MFS transporter [Actinomycetota bacterium]